MTVISWGHSSRNVGKPHIDEAACPRKFHWILSPPKLQDFKNTQLTSPYKEVNMTSAFRWETRGVAGYKTDFFLYIVHSPINALFIKLGKVWIHLKIHIIIASTCFGLRPSSGSLYRAWLKLHSVKLRRCILCGDFFVFVLYSEPRTTLLYRWHSAVSDKTLFIAQYLRS